MSNIGREIRDEEMSAADRETKRILIELGENAKAADSVSVREQYRGKFIAVRKRQVIGADSNIERLYQKLGDRANNPETFIGYIPTIYEQQTRKYF